MNKDIITQVLQEILQEDPYYFLPKQLHILTWKSQRIEGALITKVNGQRYLGLPRKDSKGQDYWRYKLLKETPNSGESSAQLDSIDKFQQRQEQVNNYANNSNSSKE